jgi:SAM-dependent methyltransferase
MFSEAWEGRFSQGKSHSLFPWTDLISYISKYRKIERGDKVLELGPGVGANIPYFLSRGAEYYAIEGSKTAVSEIIKRFPELKDRIVVGDFTEAIPFPDKFKLVIDRGSITHNSTVGIQKALKMVHDKLDNDGKYFGIDWFSWFHGERPRGKNEDDIYTYSFEDGKLEGHGKVHFSTKSHLFEMFIDADIRIEVLHHKTIQGKLISDDPENIQATWNVVGRKMKA